MARIKPSSSSQVLIYHRLSMAKTRGGHSSSSRHRTRAPSSSQGTGYHQFHWPLLTLRILLASPKLLPLPFPQSAGMRLGLNLCPQLLLKHDPCSSHLHLSEPGPLVSESLPSPSRRSLHSLLHLWEPQPPLQCHPAPFRLL